MDSSLVVVLKRTGVSQTFRRNNDIISENNLDEYGLIGQKVL